MLARFRRPRPDPGAAYAVAWINLRKRFPGLRHLLVTGASSGDDASLAAVELAEAAVRLDGGQGLILILDSAMQDRRVPETDAAVRIIVALSPGQVRGVLAEPTEDFAFVMVVAPPPQYDPECITVAPLAEAAVIAARAGQTRFRDAQLAADMLRQAGVATGAALLLSHRSAGRRPAKVTSLRGAGRIADLRPRSAVSAPDSTVGIELLS
jgi:hypothetical protein